MPGKVCDNDNGDQNDIAGRISLIQGDITKLKVDAIVNAARRSLLGGGGVDGAIHRAAGPSLLSECRDLNGCEFGEAKITKGYDLPAQYVIHTVGPNYWGAHLEQDKDGVTIAQRLLEMAYRNSLKLASDTGVQTIAFPSISTGAYLYPVREASRVAIATIGDFLKTNDLPKHVYLIAFSSEDFEAIEEALNNCYPPEKIR